MSVAAAVSEDLLDILGLETWDHAPPGLSKRAMAELNATLQAIYALLPDGFWRESGDRGINLRAPTTVSVTVTANSKNLTFGAYASWMDGCTIVIPGDARHNRLVRDAGATPSLWLEYTGTSGTVDALVYHDAITVQDAEEIIGPVMLDGHWELFPVAHERQRQLADPGDGNIAATRSSAGGAFGLFPMIQYDRMIGTPSGYLLAPAAYHEGGVYLRILLTALPDIAYTLTYKVKATAPAKVTSWEDARTWLVPHGYDESTLMPIVRFRMCGHPNFPLTERELQASYDTATKILSNLRPRGHQSRGVEVGGDW
jgi:hypothetical protein